MDNPLDFNGIHEEKALAGESGLKGDKNPYNYKDLDKIITPEHKESIRKIE